MEQPIDDLTPKREMTEEEAAYFDKHAQVHEEETDQFEIVGEDHGAKRVLSTMNIVPTNATGQNLSKDMVLSIATKHFEKHCAEIGWWPSGEYPDVTVARKEDGTWLAVAFLKESTHRKIKHWEDFPRVGVDGSRDGDTSKNASTTTF